MPLARFCFEIVGKSEIIFQYPARKAVVVQPLQPNEDVWGPSYHLLHLFDTFGDNDFQVHS